MSIVINNLAFERNYHFLFNEINSSLNPGELLQVRGANGSGKSTLLRILAGYIEPHAGNILWQNKCIFKQRDQYQQQIQYLGHQNGLKPNLTVYENLQLNFALINQKPDSLKISAALKKVDLYHLQHKQIQYLSAGQARRLALSRLLLRDAPLWILDEPTTALDIHGQQLFADLLQQHLAADGMIVLTAHHELTYLNKIKTLELQGEQNV